MRKIMVGNPKGGCGKSTLSVHIASWFARHDEIVYLGDLDRQQSSRHWLEARPENLATIALLQDQSALTTTRADGYVSLYAVASLFGFTRI